MSSRAGFPDQHRVLAKGARPKGQIRGVLLTAAETEAIAEVAAVGVQV